MGWMPIAGEEFVFEMTVNCLLYPGGGGVPEWNPGEIGERMMVKLPEQFKELFKARRPLDEDTGEALARWAAGDAAPATSPKAEGSPAGMLAKVAKLGKVSDAEARILAKLGRNHASELQPDDRAVMYAAGKRISDGEKTFDEEFPALSVSA